MESNNIAYFYKTCGGQVMTLVFTVTTEQKAANKSSYNLLDIVASVFVVLIAIYIAIAFSRLGL